MLVPRVSVDAVSVSVHAQNLTALKNSLSSMGSEQPGAGKSRPLSSGGYLWRHIGIIRGVPDI